MRNTPSAITAARRRAAPAEPLTRREALAEAPGATELPAGEQAAYRRAYADELERLGKARPAKRSGPSGPSGEGAPVRALRIPDDEWAECKEQARRAGEPVSSWARRALVAAARSGR